MAQVQGNITVSLFSWPSTWSETIHKNDSHRRYTVLEYAYYSSAESELFLLVVALVLMVLDIRDFSQLSKLSKQIDSLGEEKPYDGKIRKTSPVYAESENSTQFRIR